MTFIVLKGQKIDDVVRTGQIAVSAPTIGKRRHLDTQRADKADFDSL